MANDKKVVVGSYRNPEDVRAALQRLERDGYDREDITLYMDKSNVDRIEDTEYIETLTEEANRVDDSSRTDRSFWERIRDMVSYDDPERERTEEEDQEKEFIAPYREDIRDGYTVIAVKNYIGDAGKEMESEPMDLDEEPEMVPPPTSEDRRNQMDDTRMASESEKIQLKEEKVNVKKEEVQTGEVNVRKETVEDTEVIEVPVKREQIVVERRPVGDATTDRTDSKADEETESFTIPIKEEKIIVEKEPVVTEEVEVKKELREDTEHVTEDVRREELDVDATGRVGRTDSAPRNKDMDEHH